MAWSVYSLMLMRSVETPKISRVALVPLNLDFIIMTVIAITVSFIRSILTTFVSRSKRLRASFTSSRIAKWARTPK